MPRSRPASPLRRVGWTGCRAGGSVPAPERHRRGRGRGRGRGMDELGFHRVLHRPGTLLDVGAHDGAFTLPFAALPNSRVLAFEPLPSAFARLQEAAVALPNVALRQEALGDAEGEITLTL